METPLMLDSILKELEKHNWYIDFSELCNNLNVPDNKRKYILSKLSEDEMIDISSTKTSLGIKITDSGRVFINESSYSSENQLKYESNSAMITGNNNTVIQGTKDSEINMESKNVKNEPINKKNYTKLIIILAILSLIATVIIGWDNIINFFTK